MMKRVLLALLISIGCSATLIAQEEATSSGFDSIRDGLSQISTIADDNDAQLEEMTEKLNSITATSQVQQQTITELGETITSIRESLKDAQYQVEIAADRMTDAEQYATAIDLLNQSLQKENEKLREKNSRSWIGAAILTSGFSASAAWATYDGVSRESSFNAWSLAPAGISSIVYVLGHVIFDWF